MTEKWTPGPWTMETVRTSCGLCHKIGPFPSPKAWQSDRPTHACIYDDYPPNGGSPDLVANAHLIAAAPDLYEALAETIHACFHYTGEDQDGLVAAAYERATAALSRARGE